MVIGIKQRIVEDTDGSSSKTGDEEEEAGVGDIDEDDVREKMALNGPSADAMSKFTDYRTYSSHCEKFRLTFFQSFRT